MRTNFQILGSIFVAAALSGSCAENPSDQAALAEQAATSVASGAVTATLETTSSWSGGFCQSVTLKNAGSTVTNWTLKVATNGATLSSIWSASQTTSGTTMTVTPSGYNSSIPNGGSVNFGYCGSGNSLPTLSSLTVSGGSTGVGGAASTGGTTAKGGTTATGGTTAKGGSPATGGTSSCPFPTSFKWSSTGVLATPKAPSGQSWASLKDFTVTKANGKYVVYGTVYNATTSSYGGFMLNTSDLTQMSTATQNALSKGAVAPTLVYFDPKKTWVLFYQWGFPVRDVDRSNQPVIVAVG